MSSSKMDTRYMDDTFIICNSKANINNFNLEMVVFFRFRMYG